MLHLPLSLQAEQQSSCNTITPALQSHPKPRHYEPLYKTTIRTPSPVSRTLRQIRTISGLLNGRQVWLSSYSSELKLTQNFKKLVHTFICRTSYPHSNKHKELLQLALLKGNLKKLIGSCRRVLCVGSREMP